MKQNRALPGWCGILDGLISEIVEERDGLCPENKAGVDVVSKAPPTPTSSERRHRTREAIANE
ncbi:MAG: hypothetical protein C5S38_01835 [Candidatus Methanophagaceae archaeon]|nr:MAG: hypothetical protein C5S38_01835 [Methanophagales archaeon]